MIPFRRRLISFVVTSILAMAHPGISLGGAIVTTGTKWIPMGPQPSYQFFPGGETGRATSIAVNPLNPLEVWLGTAGGGVWRSTDGGKNWASMSDAAPSLAIGSIALADCHASPDYCHAIYVGTGENAIRRDTYYGAGLLVGAFDGTSVTWTLRDGQPTYDFKYGTIYNVVLKPGTSGASQVLYITLSSGVTASATESTVTAPLPLGGHGIYKSTDNGATWTKLLKGRPTDLEMDPSAPDTLYAGILGMGIYKTTDGGSTWCPLDPGIPQPAGCAIFNTSLPNPNSVAFDHVEIAVGATVTPPSGPAHLYASFGQCPDRLLDDCQPMIYESTDGGLHWVQRYAGTSFPTTDPYDTPCPGGYTRYTHALAISPSSSSTLFLGGIHLCVSTNSGQTWSASDANTLPCATDDFGPGSVSYCTLHFDHHAIVFGPASGGTPRAYDANDGGFAFSIDGGQTWTPGVKGLSAVEFQSISGSPWTSAVIGGTQDNAGMEWVGSMQWNHLECCGDGGFAIMEQNGSPASLQDDMYITSNVGTVGETMIAPIRSQNGGSLFEWDPLSYGYDQGIYDTTQRSFYPPFFEDSGFGLWFGTQSLFVSHDGSAHYTAMSPTSPPLSTDAETEIVGGQDAITAIGVAPSNTSHVYLGYYSGKTFWSTAPCTVPPATACDASACWRCGRTLPGPVTWIAVDPGHQNIAYATVSGFGTGAHVYKTGDGGATWKPLSTPPELSGVPANTIAIDPGDDTILYLGTDQGVYRSTTSGTAWERFSDGIPNVPVYAFALDPTQTRIIAATHGRGAYSLSLVLGKEYVAGPVNVMVLDQPVFGMGLLPDEVCNVSILQEDGTVCASGANDSLGGRVTTDDQGFLVSNKTGFFTNMPMVWTCSNSQCLGADAHACNAAGNPMAAVEVDCGTQTLRLPVARPADGLDPAPSLLSVGGLQGGALAASLGARVEPAAGHGPGPLLGGSFQVLPSVAATDGSTRLLCTVDVPFGSADSPSVILQNARDAVNADSACVANGVSARFIPGTVGFETEDIFARTDRLALRGLQILGSEMVASVRALPGEATGLCFDASRLDSPGRGQLQNIRVRLTVPPSGAAGGTVTMTEHSSLGDCAISVPTPAGASGATIASDLAAAFQGPGIPGPFPTCPSDANPRDVNAHGNSVVTAFASEVEICSSDPGVGLTLAPAEICFTSADCDDQNPCTIDSCDPATGQCHSSPAPDGQSCDDANPCTVGNACQGGHCGAPVVCNDGNPCTTDTCDAATGACLFQQRACNDGNPCTVDSCNAASGACVFMPTPGAACDDGDPCSAGDVCVLTTPGNPIPTCQGVPKCNDGDPCTADHCDPATGACLNAPIQCDDGNPCTLDACQSGTCVSTVVAGATCDDGNRCTTGDTCVPDPVTGIPTCQSQPVNCDDGNACTNDACDPITGGCLHAPVPDPEVGVVLFTSATRFHWPAIANVTVYNTYRGTIPTHLLGSRLPGGPVYDQTCFEQGDSHGDGALVSTDPAIPPQGTAFYYKVTAISPCGEGPLGEDSNGTPVPNTAPCP